MEHPAKRWPAKKTKNGVTGFSLEAIEGVEYQSYSRIRLMRQSMAHYALRYIDGDKPEPTPQMIEGKLVHKALLEHAEFKERYIMPPDKRDVVGLIDTVADINAEFKRLGVKPKKMTKPELEEFLLKHDPSVQDRLWSYIMKNHQHELDKKPDALEVTRDQADRILGMVQKLQEHERAWKFLIKGFSEVHAYWWDEELQTQWYAVLDYLRFTETVAWLTELKTTHDASPSGFPKQMDTLAYHLQNWIYHRVVAGITGMKTNLVQLAIEMKKPYGIGVYEPDERVQETSKWEIMRLIARFNECKERGKWPCYEEKILPLGLPNYAYYRIEQDAENEVTGHIGGQS